MLRKLLNPVKHLLLGEIRVLGNLMLVQLQELLDVDVWAFSLVDQVVGRLLRLESLVIVDGDDLLGNCLDLTLLLQDLRLQGLI